MGYYTKGWKMHGVDPRIVAAFNAAHDFTLEDSLVLLAKIGSHSHGTYVPPTDPQAIDDVDYMGLIIPPEEYLLGLKEWEHWVWKQDELDVVFYSLRKAVQLLLKSNPNVLGLLWLRPEDYVYHGKWAKMLLDHRELFSSLRAYPAFMGYAHDQLKRMERFDQEAMDRYEELTSELRLWSLVPENWLALNGVDFDARLRSPNALTVNRVVVEPKLRELRQLHRKHFSGYLGDKRKALVRKYGYDTKNAAHLIRLMRMCIEFLETGQLAVYRQQDGELLRSIKRGEWSLTQVQVEADRLFALANVVKGQSQLPQDPDEQAAGQLVVDIHREHLYLISDYWRA